MALIASTPKMVTVFGGSGFLGRHVVGLDDQTDPPAYERALAESDHAVNCVGILHESGRQTFTAVQDFGARAIAEVARANGIGMTQVSAIGSDAVSESGYARTKAAGVAAVMETVPDAVVLRPSIMFGPEDSFFNRFAEMARFSPALPMIGGGQTKFQPVYVGDVAEAVARAVDGKVAGGKVYDLGGPEVLSFRECMEIMLEVIERKRYLVTIPWWLADLQASVLQVLPGSLLTRDQVKQLKVDNVVSEDAIREGRTLEGIGIRPQSLEAILPTYLWRFRRAGQYATGNVQY